MSDAAAMMMPVYGDPYEDNVDFVSSMVGAFVYGIHAVLFLMVLKEIIVVRGRRILTPDAYLAVGCYIIFLFAAGTTFMSAFTQFIMDMFIDTATHPNAREAEYLIAGDVSSFKVANVAFVVVNVLSAGFLIHRTWSLYDKRLFIAVPLVLLFLASTAFSIVAVLRVVVSSTSFRATSAINYATIYVSLSSALNLFLFILLLAHLLPQREKGLTWSAIAFESALPLALSTIVFVTTYASGNAIFNIFFAVHAQMMCLAALTVGLRIVYRCSVPTPASNRTVTSVSADFSKGTQNTGVSSGPDEMVIMSEKWSRNGNGKRPHTGESGRSDRTEEAEIISLDAREENV